MRTTLNLDDHLMRDAKKRAAETGRTLTEILQDALRAYLRPPTRRAKAFRFEPVVKHGTIVPGVDWDDRDALYERMDGR